MIRIKLGWAAQKSAVIGLRVISIRRAAFLKGNLGAARRII